MMTMTSTPLAHRNRGFTLIEILISVVIGILGIIVMFQVLTLWDSLKRTTAAGSDAQIAGTVALVSLERDLRPAGMGFGRGTDGNPVPSMGCTVSAASPATSSFLFAPVHILQGTTGVPDKIISIYGNSALFVSTQKFKASSNVTKTVDGSDGGYKLGDWLVVGGAAASDPCDLVKITASSLGVLTHTKGSTAVATTGFLYNLGASPQRNVWSIQNGRLNRGDSLAGTTTDIADNIIDLQAEYGIDGSGGGNATDGVLDDDDWTTSDPSDWTRLLAVRIALLSRSQQFEKTEVTPAAPTWAGGTFDMVNSTALTGATGDVANWKHYRYRVYEKVIPLRNMVWGGDFK